MQKRLETAIEKHILQGVKFFCAGGALGFDTLAALVVIELKKKYPHIELILVLPFRGHERDRKDTEIKTYNFILENADEVRFTSWQDCTGCMRKRNYQLVDYSRFCICWLVEDFDETIHTVKYAQDSALRIMNLA